jgi:hypothetical protein
MLCLQPKKTERIADAKANWMLWSGAAASFRVLELQAGGNLNKNNLNLIQS